MTDRLADKVLNADLLATTAELAEAAGSTIHTSTVDLSTKDGAKALMDGVIQQHGRIDCLITAASFVDFVPIGEMTLSQRQHTMKGELDTVFLSISAAWPHMVAQQSGAIVNFGSLAGLRASNSADYHVLAPLSILRSVPVIQLASSEQR